MTLEREIEFGEALAEFIEMRNTERIDENSLIGYYAKWQIIKGEIYVGKLRRHIKLYLEGLKAPNKNNREERRYGDLSGSDILPAR